MAEKIAVTAEEYESEQRLISQLEAQLVHLQAQWLEKTKAQIVVSPAEYARQEAEAKRLEEALHAAWSRWGRYMYERRHFLERAREVEEELARTVTPEQRARLQSLLDRERRRAAAYLGVIRTVRSTIATLQRSLTEKRAELARKAILTPELAALKAQIEEWQRRLERERDRLERKVIARNKLVAMHKRWQYKSPRGTYHDISVEGVASIIISGTERKEEYEEQLKDFLEEEMYKKEGFERLTDLEEKVEGFEEKPTDRPVRGMRLEKLEWWHKVFKTAQLKLDDFMRE